MFKKIILFSLLFLSPLVYSGEKSTFNVQVLELPKCEKFIKMNEFCTRSECFRTIVTQDMSAGLATKIIKIRTFNIIRFENPKEGIFTIIEH